MSTDNAGAIARMFNKMVLAISPHLREDGWSDIDLVTHIPIEVGSKAASKKHRMCFNDDY